MTLISRCRNESVLIGKRSESGWSGKWESEALLEQLNEHRCTLVTCGAEWFKLADCWKQHMVVAERDELLMGDEASNLRGLASTFFSSRQQIAATFLQWQRESGSMTDSLLSGLAVWPRALAGSEISQHLPHGCWWIFFFCCFFRHSCSPQEGF